MKEEAGNAGGCCQDERGDPKRVITYVKDILAGEDRVGLESDILKYSLGSLLALVLLGIGLYALGLGSLMRAGAYPLLLFLGAGTSVMTVASYSHMSSYRKGMSCQNGMMVGMTTGMMSGFLSGALLGATNGMFIGSVAGTAIGISVGLGLGRFSGIMGAMEGAMAGLMSGTMGAMLSVMMINDNLTAFLLLLFGIAIIIFGGLSYMMSREAGPAPGGRERPDLLVFFLSCIAFAMFLSVLMLYGPRGPITIA